jgi:hypothetical protein
VIGAVRAAQQARRVLAPADLGEDRAQPARRRGQRQRRRDRRLADPALAGDDDQLVVEEGYSSPSQ